MLEILTDDFFGVLKGKTVEMKKLKIIEVYRYFYRFSMEKLQLFIDDAQFMMFFLYYVRKC